MIQYVNFMVSREDLETYYNTRNLQVGINILYKYCVEHGKNHDNILLLINSLYINNISVFEELINYATDYYINKNNYIKIITITNQILIR